MSQNPQIGFFQIHRIEKKKTHFYPSGGLIILDQSWLNKIKQGPPVAPTSAPSLEHKQGSRVKPSVCEKLLAASWGSGCIECTFRQISIDFFWKIPILGFLDMRAMTCGSFQEVVVFLQNFGFSAF